MKYQGFTQIEHLTTGARLRDLHFRIWDLLVMLQEAYPKTSRPMRAMLRLASPPFGLFCRLRSRLDDAFFRSFPDAPLPGPYYGWKSPIPDDQPVNLAPMYLPQRRKPSCLSLDAHHDVAVRLNHIESELTAIAEKIPQAFRASSPAGKEIDRIAFKRRPILALRLAMEAAAIQEHGREGMAPYWQQTIGAKEGTA